MLGDRGIPKKLFRGISGVNPYLGEIGLANMAIKGNLASK
jgi:hypothetical protein